MNKFADYTPYELSNLAGTNRSERALRDFPPRVRQAAAVTAVMPTPNPLNLDYRSYTPSGRTVPVNMVNTVSGRAGWGGQAGREGGREEGGEEGRRG